MLDGHTLRLELVLIVKPRDRAMSKGTTDAAIDVGRRLAHQAGLDAQQLVGEDYEVTVDRKLSVT
ncbi:hypothetical protein [Thiobacillus sp.]|uniref:hypothetical protein n=1 Tax=Thiobacillus sp. TaxID=924 RepID=UPI00185224A1|nr:hypothetical protein [Thiobacillus sp.]MBC2731378.1 hypothetical protein [Thiobacillus sp.]MBC2740115.1 hypothetical protein [Thiobacillus sp.]MBC2758327.1 hypothetical protein [Thiobacillus sp.]